MFNQNYDLRYIMTVGKSERLGVVAWLEEHVGPRQINWSSQTSLMKTNIDDFLIQFYFAGEDAAPEALFRLTFEDECIKHMPALMYSVMFSPRYLS